MDDKYRTKIRKLLALAMSDNPHEAERAKSQAIAMMRMYNIMEEDIEIIEQKSAPIKRRKRLKYSEMKLLQTICQISGCEYYFLKITSPTQVRPVFVGLEHDAKLADYTWEILLKQLLNDRENFRSENLGIGRQQADLFCERWVFAVRDKIEKVFAHKPVMDNVSNFYKRLTDKFVYITSKQPRYDEHCESDIKIAEQGEARGKNARLFQPTSGQSIKKVNFQDTDVSK